LRIPGARTDSRMQKKKTVLTARTDSHLRKN
jgi:hypothetical protein